MMNIKELNEYVSKQYSALLVLWLMLIVYTRLYALDITIESDAVFVAVLVTAVVLFLVAVFFYLKLLHTFFKYRWGFAATWGRSSEHIVFNTYAFDNTLMLAGSTCMVPMLISTPWVGGLLLTGVCVTGALSIMMGIAVPLFEKHTPLFEINNGPRSR